MKLFTIALIKTYFNLVSFQVKTRLYEIMAYEIVSDMYGVFLHLYLRTMRIKLQR